MWLVAPQPMPGCETALKRQAIDRPSLARRADKAFASASTPRATFSAIRRDGPAGDRGYTAMRRAPSKRRLRVMPRYGGWHCTRPRRRCSPRHAHHRHVGHVPPHADNTQTYSQIVSFTSVVRNIARALRTKKREPNTTPIAILDVTSSESFFCTSARHQPWRYHAMLCPMTA